MTVETAAQSAALEAEADAARAAWDKMPAQTQAVRRAAWTKKRAELTAVERDAQNDDSDILPWQGRAQQFIATATTAEPRRSPSILCARVEVARLHSPT